MKNKTLDYKKQLAIKARQLGGLASYERAPKKAKEKDPNAFDPDVYKGSDLVFGDIPRQKGEGRQVETFDIVEQFRRDHEKIIGKVAVLLLCLFWFEAKAQVFVTAPGYVVFQYGRDTVDTAAMPTFFALLGDDAKTADKRTAELLDVFNSGVDAVDRKMQSTLQGVGLREYVWFRGFMIGIEEIRQDHKSAHK